MKRLHKGYLVAPLLVICIVLYLQNDFNHYFQQRYPLKDKYDVDFDNSSLIPDPGIMFVQTTNEMEPTPLALCAVESAARENPDKPVYYFMKGLSGNLSQYPFPQYFAAPMLSSIKNVVLVPLKLKALFQNTPLSFWYQQVNSSREQYWIHVLSDACRIALLWKYGGIYLDTDIISLKPLNFTNFICSQGNSIANNAALGFQNQHQFMWDCMEDFVTNYNGQIWGQQGPGLISRVLKQWCQSDNLDKLLDLQCNGISFLSPRYFYPIAFAEWQRFFQPWNKNDIESFFPDTKGVHIWNFMNKGQQKRVVAGSGTLIERLFLKYCPTTYKVFVKCSSFI
ncbi:alpha-1,4-N-acetylglucosaminyltransferase-like [Callorhinchus milii]|uniref:Alpha-1,4-N-acetylglucosaminyltransferase n=1 Tax=Callorhinchus milii TaxID=7868 RepID=A0A4W3I8D3_CALMI|nr:lactosylceramide 4-alpha-galactosyltransferase-like isoform X1 [Callorhinchus milii]XP_007909189.1 lactosylceramide 4-alpha-galactosyltransferase-like isoform X1 [Callorhinchus milii]XP_042194880.1 lactosylceramide 4-alpha-galactosyltransferase-like isoform X1 [Callorhinchus milii]XP_042195123.1 alpha-1,4-N-acetylglucosaminyltransferase-like [Callorhinchus milii]|eukprot:gi/632934358/ref/XP_007909138.1/ PREDICTED: lactosylceramide 4-alpha-galactosyltransferase-like [Callorhinchus milii]